MILELIEPSQSQSNDSEPMDFYVRGQIHNQH
ncbi:hypothetical protein NKDENANG_01714 [Candidatus Entotheonellaceae bacterium PAL068K]